MTRVDGSIALVTGAGAGIGRAIAMEWAKLGGETIVSDIAGDAAKNVAREIEESGGKARAIICDIGSAKDIDALIEQAMAWAPGIDALFNVAGANTSRTVEELDDEHWFHILDVNLSAIYRLSKLVVPIMRRQGGGAIVNVASLAGITGSNRAAAYCASKGGVVMLTKNMAMDLAEDGIRVNAICPGPTRTPRIERYWKSAGVTKSALAQISPMKRSAEPVEIAKPAIFLASSDASYMTGSIVVVDGGLSAGIANPLFNSEEN